MKYFKQTCRNDYAAACIAMLASYYNIDVKNVSLKDLCKRNVFGTSLYELIKGAKKTGLNLISLFCRNKSRLIYNIKQMPFIAHISIKFMFFKFYHYVVINKIENDIISIYDPNPLKGIYMIKKEEFLKKWSGYIIIKS